MKKFFVLYKSALFLYLIDPLFYIASLVTLLFCVLRFFFAGHFFLAGVGTSDLRPFFTSLPYISIVTVPLLVFRLRCLISEDSIPLLPAVRFSSLVLAVCSAFAFSLLLLTALPLCVNLFGAVDFGQAFAGYIGIILYSFAAAAFSLCIFSRFTGSTAFPLLLSIFFLALVNLLHLLPLYVETGSLITFFCQHMSFAWRFNTADKGILDSRDIAFYLLATLFFILISVHFECRRTGRMVSPLTKLLLALILFFSALAFHRLYFRIDLTQSRTFTLSKSTRELVERLENPLRITYYRSPELKKFYPQTNDVAEYLATYCSQDSRLSLQFESPDGDKLNALGIQGQQIRNERGTKTEFITVYSAVLMQYQDKQTLIPFVLSTDTLEYDLTRRVQDLVTGRQKKVFILAGNGRSIQKEYDYVSPWLNAMGFATEIIEPGQIVEKTENALPGSELLVFGSSALSRTESAAIEHAVFSGIPTLIATSPYSVAVEDDWTVRKNKDTLLPVLNSWGFTFGKSLVNDIANLPLMLQSADADALQYTVNYPLWLSLLPQESTHRGLSLFWASPMVLYENTKPLLVTTTSAWITAEAGLSPQSEAQSLFQTNAFTLPKSAKDAHAETAQFIVAAYNEGSMSGYYESGQTETKVAVIADQYMAHSAMTAFTATERGSDFRNYDFLALTLLRLRGDDELASLLEKAAPNNSLYKINDMDAFKSMRNTTLFVLFILLPLALLALALVVRFERKRFLEAR